MVDLIALSQFVMSENPKLAFALGHELFLALTDDVAYDNAAFDVGQFTGMCLRNLESDFYYEEGTLYVQYTWMDRSTEIRAPTIAHLLTFFPLIRNTITGQNELKNRVRFRGKGLHIYYIERYDERPETNFTAMLNLNSYNMAIQAAFNEWAWQTSSVSGNITVKSSVWTIWDTQISIEHVTARGNAQISAYYLSANNNTWEILQEWEIAKVVALILQK